jgi:tRNA uridine 5-carboxymethylaminomethyl modification enzyme
MFTSRAEFRLLFNHGSSELRYIPYHENTKLISSSRKSKIKDKRLSVNHWIDTLNNTKAFFGKTFGDLMRSSEEVSLPTEFNSLSFEIQNEVIYRVKYEGYLKRELLNIDKFRKQDGITIPSGFSYEGIPGLRNESIEKLSKVSPNTLGQASRIPGVNPSDVEIILIMIQKLSQT